MTTGSSYRIVPAVDLQIGDVIRTTRARVKAIEIEEASPTDLVTARFTNGASGVVRGTTRIGVYRRPAEQEDRA